MVRFFAVRFKLAFLRLPCTLLAAYPVISVMVAITLVIVLDELAGRRVTALPDRFNYRRPACSPA